ncbi:MAG: hypothetical protein VZR73_11775, partial [Acutalibacteraceae bacterium]|nr:hypothetical protein [Acutalibacteraceae bacterium]
MKPQDFMEALGSVSQEKLDALAKWQNAKTPITGEAPAKGERITQTAAEPVSAARRRGTMKQKVKTKASAVQFLPWKFGIGVAVAACAAIAIIIGGGIISLDKQMQVGSNVGTSITEQIAESTTDEVNAVIIVQHEPVEIIEKLISSGGNDSTMMKLPPEGAVQVLRSVEDAEACCQYSDENVADQPFDFRNKLTEDVFAEYDVLYFAFKDEQKPQYCYSVDLAGGSIAADGSTLKLDFHALMFDPAHLPSDWCSVTEPDWNTYYFYTVPKNTLPDLNAIELSFEEYPLGEIPDEILANPHENVGVTDDGKTIMALQEYLETTKEYLNWLNSVPKPKYITWAEDTPVPPEDCTEVQEISADTAQSKQYVKLMQEYYTQKTGIPCDYDFSGMGKDLDETIETDDASIHIKGMVGCDWTMFVFFDVEPLNLSPENTEHFSSKSFSNLSDNMCLDCGILDANGNPIHSFNQTCRTMPAQQSLDNGIFHCYSIINNHSDEAVTGGEKYLGIGKRNGSGVPEYEISIPLDCLQSTPLQESSLAAIVSTFIPDNSEQCYY